MLDRFFFAHPRSVGESYFQHMASALSFFGLLVAAAGAALIHALLPALFEKTASRIVVRLHDRMHVNRHRAPRAALDGETRSPRS